MKRKEDKRGKGKYWILEKENLRWNWNINVLRINIKLLTEHQVQITLCVYISKVLELSQNEKTEVYAIKANSTQLTFHANTDFKD